MSLVLSNTTIPNGVVRLRVDRVSGLRVMGKSADSVMEYFLAESIPDWPEARDTKFSPEGIGEIF